VDQDEWMIVRLGKTQIGSLRTSAEAQLVETSQVVRGRESFELVAEGYTSTAHLEVGPGLFRARIITVARLNRRLELEDVRVRVHVPGLGQRLMDPEQLDAEELPEGAYEFLGKVVGGEMLYRLRRDSAVQFGSFRLPRPVTVADSITPILRGNMLTKNVVYSVDIMDPMMANRASSAEVEWVDSRREPVGDSLENVKVVELRFQGTKTRLIVDQNGTVLRREIPLFAGTQSPGIDELKGAEIIFERVPPDRAREEMPSLAYVPAPRPIQESELRGKDQGEVIAGISAFGMLSGNLPQFMQSGIGGE
jgi:hypothetical protein